MPRSSLMGWLGFSLLLLVLGLAFGNLILLAGAFFVLFTLLAAASIRPPSGVQVERVLPRTTCWTGDSMLVPRRISASGGMGPILVHDALPQELEVTEGNNLRVIWKWPGARTFDLSYTLTLPSRGEFHLPATEWQTQAPAGMRRSVMLEASDPARISVVPRIRGITRLNEIRVFTKHTRFQEDLARAGISDSEFRELRPYVPGDPIKLINWKATSRGSRNDALPLVNELEPEGEKAVWVFMDAANYMDVGMPSANPMETWLKLQEAWPSSSCPGAHQSAPTRTTATAAANFYHPKPGRNNSDGWHKCLPISSPVFRSTTCSGPLNGVRDSS